MRLLLLTSLVLSSLVAGAAEPDKQDSRYPFRTDFANEQLPWYQLKPGEFPPHHSDHRIGGELVEADFIHRSGVFRMNQTGELVDFTMPPFGTVYHLNAEADLRDVPLGTYFLFFLHQDEKGAFTKLATMQDQFTMDAGHGFTYRLDELKPGKLLVTKQSLPKNQPDLGSSELLVNDNTRVWKSEEQIKLTDLAVGDELLYSRTGISPERPSYCTDIWVGVETHKRATEQQRTRHTAFLKQRGLPAWIDRVDGKRLTVTLFSADRESLQALLKDEGIVPDQWAKEHRSIQAVVANEELRTYNPPVDKQASVVQEVKKVSTDCYGSSGEQWVIEPALLLEGFRKGRIIRLFAHPSWPIKDMPFGEGVYTEVSPTTNVISANQYPFRTDFANQDLPWYQPQPGEFPPYLSEHRISGELMKVDATHRAGQFRTDGTGELVEFTMPPFGAVRYLNAGADLKDLPLGMRYQFYLHPDEKGAFSKATMIMDEYSSLASSKLSYRLEATKFDEWKLVVARQIPPVKNYNGDMVRPPDLGRSELWIDDKTRVWKGDQQVKLSDLTVGDELLVNLTGRTATSRSRLTDIWIGAETHQLATEKQRKKFDTFIKDSGVPAWIESVEGKRVTITFFSGSRTEVPALFSGDPKGKSVYTAMADDELHVQASGRDKMTVLTRLPEGNTAGTYGCSGVRCLLEPAQLPEAYGKGHVIRIFAENQR